jgi:3-methyladenine DNA glycosylase AlkD
MKVEEVLAELELLGTEQNRKIYRRHGVGGNLSGVSYADMGKLKKRIKMDHKLALDLWNSGNHDARILATMIADPSKVEEKQLSQWADELDNYVLTDAFANLTAACPFARQMMEKWTHSPEEWISRAGWHVLAKLAMQDNSLSDDYLTSFLEIIESDIHNRKNFVRNAMNNTLIAIGIRNPILETRAMAAAARIGKVVVDHGETSCKTPDAATYIQKTLDRKRR